MRRHASFHDHSTQWGHYIHSGIILSGNIPDLEPGRIVRWFKRFEKPQGSGLVHFTLSMPEGLRLSDREWHDVASYVMDLSGLPPDLVPWVMAGREKTRCDHVHILSGLETWSGRKLEIATSKRFTDALDRNVRHHLGIPELDWHLPPEASLVSPIRASKQHAQAKSFAEDFNYAMDFYLPTKLDELNAALGRVGSTWTVSGSLSRGALLTPFDDFCKVSINPVDAGAHFSSKALIARLAFAKRVATARATQFIARLARKIHPDNIPILRTGKQHDIPNPGQRSAENEDGPHAGGHQETTPASDPAGTGEPRPDLGFRGKAHGVDGRDQRRLHRARSSVQGDAPELRGREQEAGFPSRRRATGRGHWLIRLRLLARALGIRVKTCFEDRGQIINATDDENAVMRLDLRTVTVDVDNSSAEAKINQLRSAFLSEQGAFEPKQEASFHDDPEMF